MVGRRRVFLDTAAGVLPNPSSPHEEGRRARAALEGARGALARLVEAKSDDVIFTSGATEANALAILGVVRAARQARRLSNLKPQTSNLHILYLPSAHASLVENAKLLEREGVAVEPLPIKNARVDTDALANLLRSETVLVAMDAVCGETGVVWNTREVRRVLDAHVGHTMSNMGRAVLHVDASQAPFTQKISRAHFGADLMTLDGGKVAPLRGIGCLIAHRTIPLAPLYEGGGQERGLRSGTQNAEGAAAFAAALENAARGREAFAARAAAARADLVAQISALPGIRINEGAAGRQAPNILNLSFPGRDTDYLAALLDEAGVAVSTKSACETDSQAGSRAVFALTGDEERAKATLRVSWGPDTRRDSLRRFAHALRESLAFIDSRAGS